MPSLSMPSSLRALASFSSQPFSACSSKGGYGSWTASSGGFRTCESERWSRSSESKACSAGGFRTLSQSSHPSFSSPFSSFSLYLLYTYSISTSSPRSSRLAFSQPDCSFTCSPSSSLLSTSSLHFVPRILERSVAYIVASTPFSRILSTLFQLWPYLKQLARKYANG